MTEIATKLVRNESRVGMGFTLLSGDDGNFYAVRDTVPYFCFQGTTIDEVINIASRAIKMYRSKTLI